eukprot:CAMPEP_0172605826 /NCGR_PEP_ID=MMETSP1068-20121228/26025_1 /TAXON_ID=35684 /ORGANISM="Pseudopedinella elastica, Strain CCMP716" /LENGTH=576 /DNA_ID=CAMNT_0013408337 /DNA_START=68 /DNA_END=1798 /DNA_ORIENTATION=+
MSSRGAPIAGLQVAIGVAVGVALGFLVGESQRRKLAEQSEVIKQKKIEARNESIPEASDASLPAPPPSPSVESSPRSDHMIVSRMLNKSWGEKKAKSRAVRSNLARRGSLGSATKLAALTTGNTKYILAMVGLPARGKSYIVKMVTRYLRWTGIKSEIFNVGNYRRKMDMAGVGADFFDQGNKAAQAQREQLAQAVQDDMYNWLNAQDDLAVAFFDATNTTKARRAAIIERARSEPNAFLFFVESICDDPAILERNYSMKLQNNDYKDRDPVAALEDFKERVRKYESVYEDITDDEDGGKISYIKLINVGQKVVTRRCSGYIPSQVAFHLMNVHISPRRIWLSRHAESVDQVRGLLGGDSAVSTANGEKYTEELARFIEKKLLQMRLEKASAGTEEYKGDQLVVMLGTQSIHDTTVRALKKKYGDSNEQVTFIHNSILNELRGGELDKMSHAQIKKKYPEIWEARLKDKLHFRYPGAGGESYVDLIQRVKPVIVELERQRRSVLVVSHLAVQRCICAYFSGLPIQEIPFMEMPIHVVTELSMEPHGTTKVLERLAESTTQVCEAGKLARGDSMSWI